MTSNLTKTPKLVADLAVIGVCHGTIESVLPAEELVKKYVVKIILQSKQAVDPFFH